MPPCPALPRHRPGLRPRRSRPHSRRPPSRRGRGRSCIMRQIAGDNSVAHAHVHDTRLTHREQRTGETRARRVRGFEKQRTGKRKRGESSSPPRGSETCSKPQAETGLKAETAGTSLHSSLERCRSGDPSASVRSEPVRQDTSMSTSETSTSSRAAAVHTPESPPRACGCRRGCGCGGGLRLLACAPRQMHRRGHCRGRSRGPGADGARGGAVPRGGARGRCAYSIQRAALKTCGMDCGLTRATTTTKTDIDIDIDADTHCRL